MARIAGIATALPSHVISQHQAMDAAGRAYAGRDDLLRLLPVFRTSGVAQRHFSFPPEYYLDGKGFEERNRDFIAQAAELAARAGRDCLRRSDVDPARVEQFYLVTTTGLATPSLDALLAGRLGLAKDVRRNPLFGLGCAGGAGALSRAVDTGRTSLVISVELSGQVFSPRGATPTDVIGAALFGDGAAAAIVDAKPGAPRVLASRSVLFPGTEHLMGWSFTADGMRLRLSKEVTEFVRTQLRPEVDAFLRDAGVGAGEIAFWALHPGGRRILDTFHEAFGLSEEALRWSRASLARVGNLSSASVLFVLADILASGLPRPGDRALVCALGPGFASELLLLEW